MCELCNSGFKSHQERRMITVLDVSNPEKLILTTMPDSLLCQIKEMCKPPSQGYLRWSPPTDIKVEKIGHKYQLTVLKRESDKVVEQKEIQ